MTDTRKLIQIVLCSLQPDKVLTFSLVGLFSYKQTKKSARSDDGVIELSFW